MEDFRVGKVEYSNDPEARGPNVLDTVRGVMSFAGPPGVGAGVKAGQQLLKQRKLAESLRRSVGRSDPVERMFTP